jgi:hypothetical protein
VRLKAVVWRKLLWGGLVCLSSIWLSLIVSLCIWNLSKVFNILALVAMCRVSMIVFMGPMEWCWCSKCCENLDLVCACV